MLIVVVLDQISQNAIGLGLPNYMVVLVGLIGGEVSKYLNTQK